MHLGHFGLADLFAVDEALSRSRELSGLDEIELTIHYGDNIETAKLFEPKLVNDLNVKKITLTPLTPVLGVHTGPKMIAIVGKRV